MPYINRAIEPLVQEVSAEYSALLLTGPRQVGKTTLLEHLASLEGAERKHVTLDDLSERALAKNDSAMFFQLHKPPVLIDEVQYAPELFIEIKKMIDAGAEPGAFWLTGSQQFKLMKLAGETLAGRIAILPFSSLSQHELFGTGQNPPFSVQLDALQERSEHSGKADTPDLYGRMYRGAMPALASGKYSNVSIFYSSYLQTYIDRDVKELDGDIDALAFLSFMTATAARCSQVLNMQSIANDIGERPEKVKSWLAILEKLGIIFYLHPYSNNQLKRTIKAPKLYFHECGLVAHLTKWSSPETLASGAMSGAFMENYVISEIRKSYLNCGLDIPLYYYRDRDTKEIDLVLESNGELHPIEVKKTASPNASMVSAFKVLDKSSIPRGQGAIICMNDTLGALNSDNLIIPAWVI
jgi:predicted AAA+ superfamily ATPase